MSDDCTEVGARIAFWLRQAYPRHAAKLLVTDLGLTSDIAERALQGKAAQHTINKLIRRWGEPFRDFIYQPLCGGQPMPTRRREFWFTPCGHREAPSGHAAYVRAAVGLKDSGQDFSVFAMRNLGYIQATLETDGTLRLRYSEKGAARGSLDCAASFLTSEASTVRAIVRSVEDSDGWTDHLDPSRHDAERVLRRGLVAREAPLGTWNIQRLRLEETRRADFQDLIRVHNDNGDPTPVAAGLGLLDLSSIFSVRNNDVIAIWHGRSLDIPRAYAGRNVLDRSAEDAPYAAMVQRRILEAQQQGVTLYDLAVDIAGRRRHYRALALRCADDRVLTCADLSDEARAA